MKKSIVFILLSLTMGLSHAVEPFVGVYGVTEANEFAVVCADSNYNIIG